MEALPLNVRQKIDLSDLGCWLWTACIGNNGYGQLWWQGKNWKAHRVTYTILKSSIPKGLQLDHLCRNRACVNPDHLEAVTSRENLLRGVGLPAIEAKKTACIRGHEYNSKNTYITVKGARSCRVCRRKG